MPECKKVKPLRFIPNYRILIYIVLGILKTFQGSLADYKIVPNKFDFSKIRNFKNRRNRSAVIIFFSRFNFLYFDTLRDTVIVILASLPYRIIFIRSR